MDGPASKRRRLSPRNSSAEADSSNATPQETKAPRPRPKRPSYASPTKSSLSRHYPQILERRRSSSPSKSTNTRTASQSATNRGDQRISESLNAPPVSTAENVGASDPGQEDDEATRQDVTAPGSPQSIPRVGGGFAASPRRSPTKPHPRPLPPPASEDDDEFSSFLGRSRRSPNTGLPISHPEPDLPPSVPDAVSSTPPRGIHSSPSRWRERNKSKKSSPLKPMASRLGIEAGGKSGLAIRGFSNQTRTGNDDAHIGQLDEGANPARQIPAYDANTDKKKERNALRDELEKLKRDLQIVNKENERIRLMQTSGRILSSADEDAVLDVVRQCLVDSESNPLPPQSHQLMKAALDPMGLLPFGRSVPIVAAAEDEENMADIKSHHPIPMTAEEELPYLQLFSPFAVTSSIAVLPPRPDHPLRQRQLITFRSRDAPGLFTSKIEMVVNAMNLSILELNLLALEPAAKAELGPFINKICTGDCNRSMQRNVGILSWAMGEWHRVAIQRAHLWSHLDRELASKGGLLRATKEMRKRKPQRKKDDESEARDKSRDLSCKTATLIRFMGQQSFELDVPPTDQADPLSSIRLEWKIGFDWVGEAQSQVAVLIGVPGKWRKVDQRGMFGKLPRLFEDLIEGGEDPAVAVKTIVALLAGDRQANDAVDES